MWSIDAEKEIGMPSNYVLLKMGKYMEKMLTTDHQEFRDCYLLNPKTNKPNKPLKFNSNGTTAEEDYYNYMKVGKIFLRSQIDCSKKLKNGGREVFEVKTRACAPMRYDI